MSAAEPLLIVVSGPSGVGKDTILSRMKESNYRCFFAVTATTRPRRSGEKDGIDYYFITKKDFERMIRDNGLLEWANVYGNLYGVPKEPIQNALNEGMDVIVKVDIQGAATIKSMVPEALSIFIAPPSMEDLRRRLTARKTESVPDLDLRLKKAQEEMKSTPAFDYVVVSQTDGLDLAISQIESIIMAEKSHTKHRRIDLQVNLRASDSNNKTRG